MMDRVLQGTMWASCLEPERPRITPPVLHGNGNQHRYQKLATNRCHFGVATYVQRNTVILSYMCS